MPHLDASRRLLLVHAHPDDESITTGATMARAVADGVRVTLVTCTQGEEGEVIPPELAHLAADHDDTLGAHRAGELAGAMAELGVVDHRYLAAPGRYRDSGMVWGDAGRTAVTPEGVRPDSFWAADLHEAADHLVEVIREVRPQVVVTYDERGGYGHPDHVKSHRVTTYALSLAEVTSYRPDLGPAWTVAKVYWIAMPRSVAVQGVEALRDQGSDFDVVSGGDLGFVVDDDAVDAVVDGSAHVAQKAAAMRAHATQVEVAGGFFALSDGVGQVIWGHEYFRLAHGVPGPLDPATGREADLFAGVEVSPA